MIRFSNGEEIDNGDSFTVTPAQNTPADRYHWLEMQCKKLNEHVLKCNCEYCEEISWLRQFREEKRIIMRYMKERNLE